jgi:hypothetical protein
MFLDNNIVTWFKKVIFLEKIILISERFFIIFILIKDLNIFFRI